MLRTHPHLATADGGHHANDRFVEPDRFLRRRETAPPDPIQRSAPELALFQAAPAEARRAAATMARAAGLDRSAADHLVLATSEVVTNAAIHGRPPFTVAMWAAPGRVVIAVSDAGPGPADRGVGLTPWPSPRDGGLGLWVAHQVCDDVDLSWDHNGFTVRLAIGRADPPGRS